MNRNENIKDPSWFFCCLWFLCAGNCTSASVDGKDMRRTKTRSIQYQLKIPDTIILCNGIPSKWIATQSNGFIHSKYLELLEELQKTKITKKEREYWIVKQMQAIGHSFIEFGQSNNENRSKRFSSLPSIQDVLLCTVWYTDGKQESFTTNSFFNVIQHESWRMQVTAIQAYIKPKKQHTGYYAKDKSMTSTQSCYQIEELHESNAALDLVTKSLAMFLERNYIVTARDGTDENSRTKLMVLSFRAEYIIDKKEELWFSYLDEANVHYSCEETMSEDIENKTSYQDEAKAAMIKLREFLQLAFYRQVSPKKCFEHFDIHQIGYVDCEGLKDGLTRLGISISDNAADICMETIGKVSGLHFRCNDLLDFAKDNDQKLINEGRMNQKQIETLEYEFISTDLDEVNSIDLEGLNSPQNKNAKIGNNFIDGTKQKKDKQNDQIVENERLSQSVDVSSLEKHYKVVDNEIVSKTLRRTEDNIASKQGIDTSRNHEEKSDVDLTKAPKVILEGDTNESFESQNNPTNYKLDESKDKSNVELPGDDSFFLCPNGFTLSYRIVTLKENLKASEKNALQSNLAKKREMEESLKVLKREKRQENMKNRRTPVYILLIPGAFMTFEAFNDFHELLTEADSSILLVGLPGLPNTSWPKKSIMNNTTHSACLGNLLKYLARTGKWTPNPCVPMISIGFGVGAAALLHFCAVTIHEHSFKDIRTSLQKGNIIAINGFTRQTALNKNNVKECKIMIQKAKPQFEVFQKISNLLISDKHINNTGRSIFMDTFWSENRVSALELVIPNIESIKKNGILKLLDGISKAEDCSESLSRINVPLVLVQSSKDNFFDPYDLCNALRESNITIVDSLSSLHEVSSCAHIIWMSCGHDVLIENKKEMMSLIKKQIDVLCRKEKVIVNVENQPNPQHEFSTITDDCQIIHGKDENENDFITQQPEKYLPSLPVKVIVEESIEIKKSSSANMIEKDETLLDKNVFGYNNIEAKVSEYEVYYNTEKRDIEGKVDFILSRIEEKEKIKAEKMRKTNEIHSMRQEDKRSFAIQRYINENNKRDMYTEHVRQKALQLRKTINEMAQKDLLENVQRVKAFKREKNRKFYSETEKIRAECEISEKENILSIDNALYPLNPDALHELCHKLSQSKDNELERESVFKLDLMRTSNEVHIINKECEEVDQEVKRLSLAICTNEFDINESKNELERSYNVKFAQSAELKAIQKQKQNDLERFNRSIQNHRIIMETINKSVLLLHTRIIEQIKKYIDEIASLRQDEEDTSNNIIELSKIIQSLENRTDVIDIEVSRVDLDTAKHVDTTLWQGIKQRMSLNNFRDLVKQERSLIEMQLNAKQKDLATLKTIMKTARENWNKKMGEKEIIENVCGEIENLMKKWKQDQNVKNENNEGIIFEKLSYDTKKIRHKTPESRTVDEQKWVSVDHLIYPSMYPQEIASTGTDYFIIDPTNDLRLSMESVKRIIKLPEQIQLALPFIRDTMELECHRLWNTITRGRGEDYFRRLDQKRNIGINNFHEVGITNIHIKKLKTIVTNLQKLWDIHRVRAMLRDKRSNEEVDCSELYELLNISDDQNKVLVHIASKMKKDEKYIEYLVQKFHVSEAERQMTKQTDLTTKVLPLEILDLSAIEMKIDDKMNKEDVRNFPSFRSSSPLFSNPWELVNNNYSQKEKNKKDKYESFWRNFEKDCNIAKSTSPSTVVVEKLDDIVSVNNEKNENIIVEREEIAEIIDQINLILEPKKSNCHRFMVKNSESHKLLKLTVSVVFQGFFSSIEYCPARLSVSMCRLPDESSNTMLLPIPIGVAPYNQQTINTSENLGRIVIQYCPRVEIESGMFEVIVSAETTSKYSINVTGKIGVVAPVALKSALLSFRDMESRVYECQEVSELIWTNMRLAERKVILLKKLVAEAKTESVKCENDIEECDAELEDSHDMTEDSVTSIDDEIKVLEAEFIHWCRLHSIRLQDLQETKEGIRQIVEARRKVIEHMEKLKEDLSHLRRMLPFAIANIHCIDEAINLSKILGSQFDEMEKFVEKLKSGHGKKLLEKIRKLSFTPAEEIRRRAKRDGPNFLTLDEKKWCTLDQSLNPHMWEWMGGNKKIFGEESILSQLNLKKKEIDEILSLPYDQLQKKEKMVRKLLNKYHDSITIEKETTEINMENFNCATRTRLKSPEEWSLEEIEWTSIDKVLNPNAWIWLKSRPTVSHSKRKHKVENVMSNEPTKNRSKTDRPLGKWVCPFGRQEIVAIWKSDNDNHSYDENRCKKLLLKYNGPFFDHSAIDHKSREERYRRNWNKVERRNDKRKTETNICARYHQILSELDRTIKCEDRYIASSVLHDVLQNYPKDILRIELERELDYLIKQDIYERDDKHSRIPVVQSNKSDEGNIGKGEDYNDDKSEVYRIQKRALKRLGRITASVKHINMRTLMHDQVQGTNSLKNKLGGNRGMCFACQNNPCLWKNNLDTQTLTIRKDELNNEILHIQQHPDEQFFNSVVARSVSNGGSYYFKRQDLIHELTWEKMEIERKLKLYAVDKELHNSYASRKNFIEVKSLHGYSTLLSIGNAQKALEREHNILVAVTVSKEVIDHILSWMLEGWYFGERDTKTSNKECAPIAVDKMVMKDTTCKISFIDKNAKNRIDKRNEAARLENKTNNIKEIETNVKFGLFCIAFMYFRAIRLVRREKSGWSDKRKKERKSEKAVLTVERKKMMEEEDNRKNRQESLKHAMDKARTGELRIQQREQKESLEKCKNFHRDASRKRKETISALYIQRLYRGHLGRKVTRRWKLKKAEINAINVLMNGCAISISRIWRGYRGRTKAGKQRREMAEFIIKLRTDDVKEEEEEYWRTHNVSRWKRDMKTFIERPSK